MAYRKGGRKGGVIKLANHAELLHTEIIQNSSDVSNFEKILWMNQDEEGSQKG